MRREAPAVGTPTRERPPEAQGLVPSRDHREGCGVCRYGLVLVTGADGHGDCYACLCERGKLKQQQPHFQHLKSISALLSDAELREYWPNGAPEATRDRVVQLLVEAKIPPKFLPWSMTSYGERFSGERDQKRYLKMAAEWIALGVSDRSDLVLYGGNGTGKTGLAIAIARALAEAQQPSLFWVMRELSIVWRDTFRSDEARPSDAISEAELLASLLAPSLLILDEVSTQRSSAFVEDTLTMIVDQRQRQQKPTILTLNLPSETLALEDGESLAELLGPTLYDRLRERGQFWAMKGLSRRKPYSRRQESTAS